jgi:bifunctional non-homologous end joining protein LigD
MSPPRSSFIEPCLPSSADSPPSGPDWIHEIKHDGYRLMARRDPVGVRLLTRRGHDWSPRFPRIVEAVNMLKVRSCLIDGEVVCCNDEGLADFQLLRQRKQGQHALLIVFDLLELDGQDLRREPLRFAKPRWLAFSADAGQACSSTSTYRTPARLSFGTPARWGWKASY